LQTPIVITNSSDLSSGVPLSSIGNIGDYAVDAIQITTEPTGSYRTYWYKTTANVWEILGRDDWRLDTPAVQGTNSNPTLTAANTFTINLSGITGVTATITVPASTNNNVAGVAAEINNLGWTGLSAEVRSGKLCIFSNQILIGGMETYEPRCLEHWLEGQKEKAKFFS
jgi:hypothetical protein